MNYGPATYTVGHTEKHDAVVIHIDHGDHIHIVTLSGRDALACSQSILDAAHSGAPYVRVPFGYSRHPGGHVEMNMTARSAITFAAAVAREGDFVLTESEREF